MTEAGGPPASRGGSPTSLQRQVFWPHTGSVPGGARCATRPSEQGLLPSSHPRGKCPQGAKATQQVDSEDSCLVQTLDPAVTSSVTGGGFLNCPDSPWSGTGTSLRAAARKMSGPTQVASAQPGTYTLHRPVGSEWCGLGQEYQAAAVVSWEPSRSQTRAPLCMLGAGGVGPSGAAAAPHSQTGERVGRAGGQHSECIEQSHSTPSAHPLFTLNKGDWRARCVPKLAQ